MLIIFVDRIHATALALPKNFVAWAMPTSHSRFQTTFTFIVFVDGIHATALALPKNFVAWASPTSQSRFQTTCPPIISVGRTHATDTVPTKTDTQSKHERSSENLHRVFRRPLCVHHFRGQSPRYGTCVAKKFVAWAMPTSHSRFQTTYPPIISVGRTHATDTAPAKTGRHFKHKRSSENLH